jgi:hypothetical protein
VVGRLLFIVTPGRGWGKNDFGDRPSALSPTD